MTDTTNNPNVIHPERHPLAGRVVHATVRRIDGDSTTQLRVEDWWDRVSGGSWLTAEGNPAAMQYAFRAGFAGIAPDDEVVYCHDLGIGRGHLLHDSEIVSEVAS